MLTRFPISHSPNLRVWHVFVTSAAVFHRRIRDFEARAQNTRGEDV